MTKNVQDWTVDEVCGYIGKLEVDGFSFTANEAANFRREQINGKLLLNLEKDDLNSLGLFKFPKRNALYKHIKRLRAASAEQSRPRLTSFTPITRSPIISTTNSPQNTILRTLTSNLSPSFGPNPITLPQPTSGTMTPLILPRSPPTFASSTTPILPMPSSTNTVVGAFGATPTFKALGSSFAGSPVFGASITPSMATPFSFPPTLTANLNLMATSPTNLGAMGSVHSIPSIPTIPTMPSMQSMTGSTPWTPTKSKVPSIRELLTAQFGAQSVSNRHNGPNGPRRQFAADGVELNVTEMRAVEGDDDAVEFPAIYQGVNSHSSTFVLMTQRHVMALNAISSALTPDRPKRAVFAPLQSFSSSVPTAKVQYGWLLGHDHALSLPFNALVVCRLNVLRDEITAVRPVAVSGSINHVNQYGQTWVASDVQIDAVEQVSGGHNQPRSNMISNIVSLALRNVSFTSLQQRANASYMLHDPERHATDHNLQQNGGHDQRWRRGLALTLCLKLSTRTNPKCHDLRKLVFCQCWNVKPRE